MAGDTSKTISNALQVGTIVTLLGIGLPLLSAAKANGRELGAINTTLAVHDISIRELRDLGKDLLRLSVSNESDSEAWEKEFAELKRRLAILEDSRR